MQAFFQESYLQEHPKDEGNIEKLKDLIAWQVQPAAPLWRLEGTAALVCPAPSVPIPGGVLQSQVDLSLFSRRPRCWQRGSGSTGGR